MLKSARWESASQRANLRAALRPPNHTSNVSSLQNQVNHGQKCRWEPQIVKMDNTLEWSMKKIPAATTQKGKYVQTKDFSAIVFFRIILYSLEYIKQSKFEFCSFGHIKGQYGEDSKEDIEDIKFFLSQSKKVLHTVRRNIPYKEEEQLYKNIRNIDNQENKCMLYSLILCILVICLLVYLFRGGKKAEFHEKLETIATNCWQKFKSEKCDLNNPLGSLCRQLYDCYLKQKKQRTAKQEMGKEKFQKRNDSLIEQFLFAILLVVGGYFAGLQRIQMGLGIAKRLLVQAFELLRQIRINRQRRMLE